MILNRARILFVILVLTIGCTISANTKRLGRPIAISTDSGVVMTDEVDKCDARMSVNSATTAKVLSLRGGKEKKSDVIAKVKEAIVSILKQVIPRSFWPASWSKGSKLTKSTSKKVKKGGAAAATAEGGSRLHKELRNFMASPPDNCKLTVGANIRVWVLSITGAEGTIYAGEKFKLKLIFPKEYPSKPPSVYFLKPTPKHVHVYSNGDICLNLLGKDWRPNMTAETLVISILSMLASAREKKMPQDNAMHADMPPGQQQDNWMYHDDKC